MQTQLSEPLPSFAEDVRRGLTSTPKFLSSKYFYDATGSGLFQEIMNMPEYYLTRSETEIFERQRNEIVTALCKSESLAFDLIELGAGDGSKTAILLEEMLAENLNFTFTPIDISLAAIESLTEKIGGRFPGLTINPRHGDYFGILETLKTNVENRTKIVLFLGSNVGNFTPDETISFFKKLHSAINKNDLVLIGFDLQKDPRLILQAYDDSQGITAAFNLNLLTRINRELGGDFDVAKFSHYAIYHPTKGTARSFLISLEEQKVFIKNLNQYFYFDQWEAVYMEGSQKYTFKMIEKIAADCSFQIINNFSDENGYYVNSLWRAI